MAVDVDMSVLDCNDVKIHVVRVQPPVPLMIVNIYTCIGKIDAPKS